MRVDIQPQWKRLANWYWDTLEGKTVHQPGMSIWEMLEQDYGAIKVRQGEYGERIRGTLDRQHESIVIFPDEASYSAFLLRWA